MIYLIVLILLLFLILHYDIGGRKAGRNQWYIAVMVILILIAGLRWRLGMDTPNYISVFYRWTPSLKNLDFESLSFGRNPLWRLLNSFIYTVGGRFYHVQLIMSSFLNILLFIYFKRHTKYIYTCVFFYYIFQYTSMNMEEMKASMSTAVFLFANDYLFEKKWIKAYTLYIIAVLFHAQALLFLFIPLLMNLRLNLRGIYVMFATLIVGYLIHSVLESFLEMLEIMDDENISAKAAGYANSSKYIDQAGGTIRMFNIFIPLSYAICCLYYLKYKAKKVDLSIIEPLCMIAILCYVMQINVNIFYRYARCFSVYLILIYAETMVRIAKTGTHFQGDLSRVKALFVFSPLIMCMLTFYIPVNKHVRYYPYSSIFDMKIDRDRESFYSETLRNPPFRNEY